MGFVLLISGLAIALAAMILFAALNQRLAFVLAGIAVELLGLVVLAYGCKSPLGPPRSSGLARSKP